MNVHASMGVPVRCEISAIGLMSAITVRAAQFALTFSRCDAISRASRTSGWPMRCVIQVPAAA